MQVYVCYSLTWIVLDLDEVLRAPFPDLRQQLGLLATVSRRLHTMWWQVRCVAGCVGMAASRGDAGHTQGFCSLLSALSFQQPTAC